MFGDRHTHESENAAQLQSYVNRFGPGMVIYWFDFLESLNSVECGADNDKVCGAALDYGADVERADKRADREAETGRSGDECGGLCDSGSIRVEEELYNSVDDTGISADTAFDLAGDDSSSTTSTNVRDRVSVKSAGYTPNPNVLLVNDFPRFFVFPGASELWSWNDSEIAFGGNLT